MEDPGCGRRGCRAGWPTLALAPARRPRRGGAAAPAAARGQTKTLIDVNKVKYQSNGFGIGVATEAMGSFLYDVRTLGAVNTFVGSSAESKSIPKYSCAFSKSGRLMFVGTEDNTIEVWDTFKPDAGSTLQSLTMNHDNRITEVCVPTTGCVCASASWDTTGSIIQP